MPISMWIAVVVLVSGGDFARAGEPTLSQAEATLEPEFRQLRATLGARPEFSGTDADSKYRLARELAHRGDVAGAVESYRAAIHLKPQWVEPHHGLGQVFLDHHDYALAVEAFQTSIRLGRDDPQAFYWLGRAYMGKGELAPAAVALEQAIRLKPDDAEAYADLGLVRMANGDLAGAGLALTTSIRLKPDYAEAHRLREQLAKAHGKAQQAKRAGLAELKNLFGRE